MLSIFILYTICISFPALLSQITRNLLASSKGNIFSQGSWDQQLEVKVSGGCALSSAAPGEAPSCLFQLRLSLEPVCLVLPWLPSLHLLSCPSSQHWSLDLGSIQMISVISFEILNFITVTKILFQRRSHPQALGLRRGQVVPGPRSFPTWRRLPWCPGA